MKKAIKKEDKSIKNMRMAFVLNLGFAIFEIIGGLYTNSISIISDAVHDLGDSFSIGVGLVLKKLSLKKPDSKFTYGYGRFSVIGALINLVVLTVGSTLIITNAIPRVFNPEFVNSSGMLIFAIIGILVNLVGTLKTSHSHDISEKVISLHLLEDLLGWILVLITSIVIKICNVYILDPILSLLLATFIIVNVIKNLKKVIDIILERAPSNIDIEDIKTEILKIKDVLNLHHIHVWSIDGNANYLTAHVQIHTNVPSENLEELKKEIKHKLIHLDIQHSTLEFETTLCEEEVCNVEINIDEHQFHNH